MHTKLKLLRLVVQSNHLMTQEYFFLQRLWPICAQSPSQEIVGLCSETGAHQVTDWRIASINTVATSGRENSRGGISPACNIWRTFVPLSVTWYSLPCGHVFDDAIASHARQKKVCSKNSGVIPSLTASNSEKMWCAS